MKKFFKQKNKGRKILSMSKGFTLIETLVAVSIFSLSILALLVVLTQSISNNNYAKKKILASYLAQEGIEYIRNMRDTYVLYTDVSGNSWTGFNAKMSPCNPSSGCRFDTVFPHDVTVCNIPNDCKLYEDNGKYSTNSSGADSGFIRKVWMTKINGNEVKIFSNVSWTQGSGTYSITFSENLFNWVE